MAAPQGNFSTTYPQHEPQQFGLVPSYQSVKNRNFFSSRGAIERPTDGEDAKPINGRCLTCIDQKASCHGTSVERGKCLSCRGFGVGLGATRPKRTCCWLEPARAIFTMRDAQRAYGLTTNSFNTREGVRQRDEARRMEALYAVGGSDDEETDPGIFEFDVKGPEYAQSRRLAVEMFARNLLSVSPIENLARMGMMAREEILALVNGTLLGTFGPNTTLCNMETIYAAIIAMSERGEGLKIADLRSLLPRDHPLSLPS